jgi:hypothetical protein
MNSTTETSAGTAPDYSTTFPADRKDSGYSLLAILLSHPPGKRKEESLSAGEFSFVKGENLSIIALTSAWK